MPNSGNQKRGLIDRTLKSLGESLADDDRRVNLLKALRIWARRFLWIGCCLYIFAVLAVGWVAEHNVLTAFFLYAPPLAWLLPIVPAAFLALLFDRGLLLVLLVWSGFHLTVTMGYEFGSGKGSDAGDEPGITVMTYNRGQRVGSLKPFKDSQKPDLLAMQEAPATAIRYLADPDYGEFQYGKDVGEFALLSRFPILSSELISVNVADKEIAIAGRFEVDLGEQGKIAVYSVHLPTPRLALKVGFRATVAMALIGYPGAKTAEIKALWEGRVILAKGLMSRIESETIPVLAVGDFNMPPRGVVYRMVSGILNDAHAQVGSGYGFTFPGGTGNPLALFGPWLRIDYLFCGDRLAPVWCEAERDRPSQHRAVAARFRFEDG